MFRNLLAASLATFAVLTVASSAEAAQYRVNYRISATAPWALYTTTPDQAGAVQAAAQLRQSGFQAMVVTTGNPIAVGTAYPAPVAGPFTTYYNSTSYPYVQGTTGVGAYYNSWVNSGHGGRWWHNGWHSGGAWHGSDWHHNGNHAWNHGGAHHANHHAAHQVHHNGRVNKAQGGNHHAAHHAGHHGGGHHGGHRK
jgi:hypothetical protein